MLKEIAKLRGLRRMMLEAFPVGDSKSNGVAERAIQSMEKLVRVHKLSMENLGHREALRQSHPVCVVSGVVCGPGDGGVLAWR